MSFGAKLQGLRKEKELTQEQLAELLFVSRTAVSKWERDAGYPNLDSLRLLAQTFELSLDELLSTDQILDIAKAEKKRAAGDFLGLSFSVLDVMAVLLLVLPLYGQPDGDHIRSVSLWALTEFPPYLKAIFYVGAGALIACGVARFVAYLCKNEKAGSVIQLISIGVGGLSVVYFIATLEPYAATLSLLLLALKVLMLFRYRPTKDR